MNVVDLINHNELAVNIRCHCEITFNKLSMNLNVCQRYMYMYFLFCTCTLYIRKAVDPAVLGVPPMLSHYKTVMHKI